MTPIFSGNIKNLKSCVQDGADIFATQKEYYSENPISIGKNGVKLQLIKQNQIYRQMTIYGPN